jgi:hypothetical protein
MYALGADGVAQVAEHLPSKWGPEYKPKYQQKKKKKKKRRMYAFHVSLGSEKGDKVWALSTAVKLYAVDFSSTTLFK